MAKFLDFRAANFFPNSSFLNGKNVMHKFISRNGNTQKNCLDVFVHYLRQPHLVSLISLIKLGVEFRLPRKLTTNLVKK